ncbi:MAG: hypothetical protein A2Y62_14360 [Candidatus Fischerbacteria bacterium RBG_13_37_8]|uniref:Uncharacterized protein n=1 Tax=Candidatus Fischerbacteria bacterium RBG_13_37_8 TaxID=1817863 RepID=A0A1F5VNM4_9BACT|nr:MAG: hypothetical protein A2Y62_14360 [Candidatus Fischerbacteria bacterium RBG_13_37_8]
MRSFASVIPLIDTIFINNHAIILFASIQTFPIPYLCVLCGSNFFEKNWIDSCLIILTWH